MANKSKKQKPQKWIIISILVILCLILIVYGAVNHNEIKPADWMTIMITLALAIFTGAYAWSAQQQADANVKTAEEMKKQSEITDRARLIPFFEFVGDFEPDRKVQFAAGVANDGLGPAYNLRFRIEHEGTPSSKEQTGDYAVDEANKRIFVVRRGEKALWFLPDPKLSFPKSETTLRRFLVIKYQDVYGEYEVRLSFTLNTGEGNKPTVCPERITKVILSKRDLLEELP